MVVWLVASSLALARALAPHPHRRLDVRPTALREHLTRGRAVGSGGFRGASASHAADAPKERWVTQPLDHFDPTDVVAADARSSGRGLADGHDATSSTSPSRSPRARTWRQRWFANDAFFDRARFRSAESDARGAALADPVVFLCVGGEGPGFDPDVVVTGGAHCALAVGLARALFEKKAGGALLVALEHRFYGASQPTGDLTTRSLRYLTSDQALADAARFVHEVAEAFGLAGTSDLEKRLSSSPGTRAATSIRPRFPRVVAFGGSYPGMLAGWLRAKYPHLVVAAVASSAPVRASLSMPGYDAVAGEALAEPDVGGSETCLWRVALAFGKTARLMLDFDGRRRLEAMFNVCANGRNAQPLEPFDNRAEFFAALVEAFPAQSNDPACDRAANAACDVRGACALMTNFSSASGSGRADVNADANAGATDASLRNLAEVARRAYGAGRCVDVNHAANVARLNVTALPSDWRAYDGDRAWFWQTCVEFGFYQTCDDERCPFFSRDLALARAAPTLAFFADVCAEAFGLDLERAVFPAAARANARTGGVTPGGSRIMYPSGSVDPWRANSFTPDLAGSIPHRSEKAVRKTLPAMMVRGASHHAWTHPPRDTDQASVVRARARITAQVEKWLEETDVRRAAAEETHARVEVA